MRPRNVLLLCWLLGTAGCAALAGPPPSPPLAVPAVGAPKEFTWSPVKWRPGLVLTYRAHSFTEINLGEREHSHNVIQFKAMDKTAKGLVRVQLLVDDLDLGSVLMDEFGDPQDAIASKPEFAPLFTVFAEWMQNQQLRKLQSRPITVGETVTVDFPTGNLRRMMSFDRGRYLPSSVSLNYQFIGYFRLGEALAAAFRAEMPNILSSPIYARGRNNRELRIDALVGESIEYFDAMEGYSLAKHEVITGGGEFGGKPLSYRSVTLTTLDRAKSSGIKHPSALAVVPPTRIAEEKGEAPSDGVFYELTREDFTLARRIRSTNISVFGIRLGSRSDDMLRAVSSSGRPFIQRSSSDPPTKDVEVFFGDEEAAAYERRMDSRMIVFRARDGVVQEILLYGTPRPPSGGGAPTFRGFDALAVGNTKALLSKCEEQVRLSIFGREGRVTPRSFPESKMSFVLYEYDEEGIVLAHTSIGDKSPDPSKPAALTQNCVLRLRQPAGSR